MTALLSDIDSAERVGKPYTYKTVYLCDDIDTIDIISRPFGKQSFGIYVMDYYYYVYADEIYGE